MRAPYCGDKTLKRKVLTKKHLMKEIYACKDCDCEQYPWCSYLGGLCRECVDLNSYTHKRPLRSKPGQYGIDKNEIAKNEITSIKYPRIRVIKTEKDGDCLYSAISLAFNGKLSVKDLRYLVATHQSEDTFHTYRELSTFMPEYRPIRATQSLRDFRVLIKRTGEDVGPTNCLWGDENALQIISTFLRLGIKIFNEKGQYIQEIVPERTMTFDNTIPTRYVLLILNSSKPSNEHYHLLEFNKHTLLTKLEWDKMKNIISSRNSNSQSSKSRDDKRRRTDKNYR